MCATVQGWEPVDMVSVVIDPIMLDRKSDLENKLIASL